MAFADGVMPRRERPRESQSWTYLNLGEEVGPPKGKRGGPAETLADRINDIVGFAELPTRLGACGVSLYRRPPFAEAIKEERRALCTIRNRSPLIALRNPRGDHGSQEKTRCPCSAGQSIEIRPRTRNGETDEE